MKKLILFAAVAAFGFSANAQDESTNQTTKGTWFFGADAGISFASNKTIPEFDGEEFDTEVTVTSFSFTPSANYFVIDNLAVGLDITFSSSNSKVDFDGDTEEDKTNTFAVIPNATYFFSDGNVRPYLGAGVGYMSAGGDEDFTKFSGLAINANGGIAYFINSSVAVNIGVEYLYAKLSNKEESDFKNKSNTLGVGAGFSFFLK